MFERLWKSLGRDSGSGEAEDPNANRRAHQRHAINLETSFQSVSDATVSSRVRVCDISRGGMKFLTRKKLEPGTLVRISLPATGGVDTEVLACVMHATLQTDGTYAIGCAFSDELSDDDLRPFGGRKEVAHGPDKRAWMRFPAQGTVDYLVLPPSGAPAKRAEITNISATGIGLCVEEKVETGAILELLLKSKTGEQSFDVLACVVFLGRRSEGGWVVGCHFVRELEESDVQRLL